MAARQYKSIVDTKTLASAVITAGQGTITLNNITNLPPLSTGQTFTLVVNPDTTTEEIVTVTSYGSGNTLNITRGSDGTTAQSSHGIGSTVKHMVTPRDLQEPQDHMNNTSDVHGLATAGPSSTTGGAVVGTTALQTLTNKTLTAPSMTSVTVSGGTLTGITLSSPNINTPAIASSTLSGTTTNSGTISGGTISAPTISTPNGGTISTAAGGSFTLGSAGTITANSIIINADEMSYLDGVTSNVQGQFTAITNAWTTYTPTVSGTGWVAGTGTPFAGSAYKQVGKTVNFRIVYTFGTGSVAGSSGLSFSLPSGLNPINSHAGKCISINGTSRYGCEALITASGTVIPFATPTTAGAANRNIQAGVPFTWGSTDSLIVSGTYEVA